jgi:hypothetical protein
VPFEGGPDGLDDQRGSDGTSEQAGHQEERPSRVEQTFQPQQDRRTREVVPGFGTRPGRSDPRHHHHHRADQRQLSEP